jgi:hypothetical protein
MGNGRIQEFVCQRSSQKGYCLCLIANRTYAVDPQTVVGAGFFQNFSLVAQSLDKPALTGFFILKCVSLGKFTIGQAGEDFEKHDC